MDIDYPRLAGRILRPARPGLAAAQAAVQGITDAAAAWQALAARAVIPAAWIDDPRRSFAGSRRHPPTVAACVALACDPAGMATVEALALAVAARLAACGAGSASRVQWRVGALTDHDLLARPPREPTGALHSMLLGVHESADTTVWGEGEPAWVIHPDVPRRVWPEYRDFKDRVAFGRLDREHSAADLWRSAALNGYRLDDVARPIAELDDPFAPLLAIWDHGYALDAIIDDTAVLVTSDPAARR